MLNLFKQGHPKGLYLLFFVEMWERFSFYGMRALIVLYMIETLSYSIQKAGSIYGFYTGCVYLTPLIGGYIADRYLGQRRCISLGAVLMTLGLFLLAFGGERMFLLSLLTMIIANGFFKSNISSLLGLLYVNQDDKKDSAFTIFYMGINLGAFFSPLICGTLAVKYGFEYGFVSAGVGMLIGFLLYKILENKLLGDCGLNVVKANDGLTATNELHVVSNQKEKLVSLIALMLFTIPFWVSFEQAGSSLTLFAEYKTNRIFWGFEIPTGYFQSLNPLFIIALAPIVSAFWIKLRERSKEPSSVSKFVIALFLISLSFILLSFAGHISLNGNVSPIWLIMSYFIMTIAELCLSPIGLSLVTKLAPVKFLSLIMGCWFLTSFLGNLIAGIWGGNYDLLTPCQLFGALALLTFITGSLLLVISPKIDKYLKS